MQHYLTAIFFTFFFIATSCSHPQTEPNMPEETADGELLNIDVAERPSNVKEFYLFNNGMIILLDDGLAPVHHQHIEVDSFAQL